MTVTIKPRSSGNSEPRIRIWAPDADPKPHKVMVKLAKHIPHIEALLIENRIAEADFTPPIARGGAEADPHLHYEMHSGPATEHMTEPLRNVRAGIQRHTGLVGGMRQPLSNVERELLPKQHGLTMQWSANLEQGLGHGK